MRQLACVLLLGLVPVSVLIAQQASAPQTDRQPNIPLFRGGVDAVLVDFTVVDREGRLVRDLTGDDVEVFEDGRRQSVTAFSLVDIPIEPAARARFGDKLGEADIASNENADGRLFLLVLDNAHVNVYRTDVVRALARQFVERNVGLRDRVALVGVSNRNPEALEFTGDRQWVLTTIDLFRARVGMSSPTTTLRYLARLANWLGGIGGRRKAIVWISEGFYVDIPAPLSGDFEGFAGVSADALGGSVFDHVWSLNSDTSEVQEVVSAAARSNVAIYAIDPRGQPGAPWSTVKPTHRVIGDDPSSKDRTQVLRALAAETGGFALTASNDFSGAFARVIRDASSYYVLSYNSDNTHRDDKFRRIQLTTTRPGLRVRARSGYGATAKKDTKSEKVPNGWTEDQFALLRNPLQSVGLGLRLTATPFRANSATSSVVVVVEARGEDLRPFGGMSDTVDGLTVVLAAAARDGKVKATGRAQFERTPASEGLAQRGVRFVSRLSLKPGRYAVRVAATDDTGSAAGRGSVYVDLDVPDFSKGPVAMSGVLLSTRNASRRTTIGFDKPLADVLNGPPTAAREFNHDDELTTMVDVYSNRKGPAGLVVTTSVQKPDGTVVFNNRQSFDANRTSSFPGVAHSARIPLRDLSVGDYLLTIEAASGAVSEKVSRQVVFTVR